MADNVIDLTARRSVTSVFDVAERLNTPPVFMDGRWTFDTTPNADRTDAVQTALFAADGINQEGLFSC